jgi:ACS family tartrate transporter-like MFS transporter
MSPQADFDTLASRTRRRITQRLVPFLFVLYILNYLDRVNISFAALQMTGELGFSKAIFGFGAGIFFIGYFLFQIPLTLLTEVWSARNFIGLSLIVWGGLATLGGFVQNANQFYWLRFSLGIAEAGFFPGVLVYLTHWYRQQDRGKAVAMFMTAIPASNMIGAAISAALMRISWMGLQGWRWLLILEGFPAVLAGLFTFFYLTDWPSEAQWLKEDERSWITGELQRDQERKKGQRKFSPLEALRNPQVLILALAYFCYITNSIGLSAWLPQIVKGISGLSTTQVILISGIPWLCAIPVMLITAGHSDRTGERRWHAAIPLFLVGFALTLSIAAGTNLVLAIAAFSLATMSLYSFPSPFWVLPTVFLSGPAAAASIALINSAGNLGGFVGPYLIGYLADKTGSYTGGLLYLVACGLAGSGLVLALRTSKAGTGSSVETSPAPVVHTTPAGQGVATRS